MPGGTGTTIIGWDSNTEAGSFIDGTPTSAGKSTSVQLAAVASGTPDTAWIKLASVDTDLQLCVWDATTGDLLIQSDILTTANQSATSGVWSKVSLASSAALVSGTTYIVGVQQQGNYWSVRQSSTAIKYWSINAGTWPNPPNPLTGTVFGDNEGQWALYFSIELGSELAGTASDDTSASGALDGWISLGEWNVSTVGDCQRRIFTAPTVLASVGVTTSGTPGNEPCGTLVSIYPVTVGTSGSFTITDNGITVFTIAAADIVEGVPIPVGIACIHDITVSEVPAGGEYGVLWEGTDVAE